MALSGEQQEDQGDIETAAEEELAASKLAAVASFSGSAFLITPEIEINLGKNKIRVILGFERFSTSGQKKTLEEKF